MNQAPEALRKLVECNWIEGGVKTCQCTTEYCYWAPAEVHITQFKAPGEYGEFKNMFKTIEEEDTINMGIGELLDWLGEHGNDYLCIGGGLGICTASISMGEYFRLLGARVRRGLWSGFNGVVIVGNVAYYLRAGFR